MADKLRVTRTIVIEGDPLWVRLTLEKSWVAPDRPRHLGLGTIHEDPRIEEYGIDLGEGAPRG